MLNGLLNSLKNKYQEKKEENDTLNKLLDTTSTFETLLPIQESSNNYLEYKISYITNTCPDINETTAKVITKLIPIDETYLNILYSKELKTEQEYYIIPTNKYLWIVSKTKYGAFYYSNLTCTIIKNNLMSKIILLNNILLEVNGTEKKIENFIKIITNTTERNNIIQEKTNYLCGIIPTYQLINSIASGISIDNNNNIVFHTKEKNYKYQIENIENYEILLDNQIYSSKKIISSKVINSFQNSCYQISIRITLKENQMIIIPILPPNTFGTKYNSHNSTFIKNLEFAKTITNKLDELTNKH